MSEHSIRLRAAWEGRFPDGPRGEPRRVDLPAPWPPWPLAAPFRLRRTFRAPRLDPAAEALALRLADVPGLVAVRFNGRDLARPVPGTADLELPLELPLPARNLLELEVDPGRAPAAPAPEPRPWGAIALVIRPRGDAPGAGGGSGGAAL